MEGKVPHHIFTLLGFFKAIHISANYLWHSSYTRCYTTHHYTTVMNTEYMCMPLHSAVDSLIGLITADSS